MKTHISLNVSDVKKSVEFYSKMFGIEPYKVKPDYAKFDIANPPLNLTMNQVKFEKGGSLSHLGLQVRSTEDVLAISKRWAERGLTTLEAMNTDCCYALQDKTWVSDPDGNNWEVFTVLEDSEGLEKTPSTCCAPTAEPVGISSSSESVCCG
ncbi:MAG: ArsI/CadI family heavy metal resistance metalloenzyme [Pyrinomonadaceae bacterium]